MHDHRRSASFQRAAALLLLAHRVRLKSACACSARLAGRLARLCSSGLLRPGVDVASMNLLQELYKAGYMPKPGQLAVASDMEL